MYKGENEGVDEGKATVLCEKISKAVREYLEWDWHTTIKANNLEGISLNDDK